MQKITQDQMDQMARGMMIRKLDAGFLRDVPDFADLADADRTEFLEESVSAAQSKGLRSEQGIASYVLAVVWLGLDFEEASAELMALLESDYPEVRKVHAMNEWVSAALGDPENLTGADEKLKQALELTKPWGE